MPFKVITDHSSLRWLQNLKEPHGKLARWAVRLQAFNITFEHRPGRLMVVPDALSRAVDLVDVNTENSHDEWYRKMKELASHQKLVRYKLENDILYHRDRFNPTTGERRWCVCVPKEKIREVMLESHDHQGHMGYWKVFNVTRKRYFWPNMARNISEHIHNCTECKQLKASNEKTRVPIGKYRDPISVGRVLSLDLVGPLPASKFMKHQYIIVCVDVFSKYVFARACTRATANVITDFLEKEIFYRFDTPEQIITDNGTQFTSELFAKFVREHRIDHVLTPNYHPQANPVESSNRSIKDILRAEILAQCDHRDWSSYLNKAVMFLNTIPRTPTGQSPHLIIFGREKCQEGNEHKLLRNANAEQEEANIPREVIYEQVAEQQRAQFEQNKNYYNLRATVRKFKMGDVVYIKNPKQSCAGENYAQKLAALKKPMLIKEIVPNASDIYKLMEATGKEVPGTYHASQIYTR